jgi:UDP-N-acetylmuramate dehydrogenase
MTPELGIQKNISLKNTNWWKVGGDAEFFAEPKNIEELKSVYAWALKEKNQIHIISGGSNILISDGLLKGLTISLKQLKGIETTEIHDHITITALAGTPKSDAARIFLQNKLAPAVFLTGIPGDLGGGVVMNAGIGETRTPREFCEITDFIEVLKPDLTIKKYLHSEIEWSYRHSNNWQPGIIVKVGLKWPNQPDAQVSNDVREATKKRVSSQPLNLPSCGSTFRNPPNHKAGKLIEEAGLKGFQIGGAQVSGKHANFLINTGTATAKDISDLIAHIQKTVKSKSGVDLETEIVRIYAP